MINFFMKETLKQAILSYKNNEIPVGCILISNNKIISRAHNLKEKTKITTNHAEIICINNACLTLNSWRLNNLSMYVSLEPCIMCAGAILESRIKNLYIGTANPFNGFFSCNYHKTILNLNIFWLNNKTCEYVLNRFFKKIRKGHEKYHDLTLE